VPRNSSTKNFSWDLYGHLPTRVRTAAHRASPKRVEQYERAYELMRALPADDPRSLSGHANFHCSFCNGALKQAGFNASGNISMQVPTQAMLTKPFDPIPKCDLQERWVKYRPRGGRCK
jgi:hypothetical protein